MFNRVNIHKDGDTNITVKGVNAPEAARFLNDIKKEAGGQIDSVVFDRLKTSQIDMEWALATQVTHVDGCMHILIYYKTDKGRRKIDLPVIKKDLPRMTERHAILMEIAKDMSEQVTEKLFQTLVEDQMGMRLIK